ncbi:MAG: DUF2029 domain-containing protein, partial [Anaerolineae bacterium]|nr:DUF2029 domain-containing protein [Anaerolineae bacterium]
MRIPFRNLGARERLNLILAAIASFYLAIIAYFLYASVPLAPVGADYIIFWSAGYVANFMGYDRIYDLDLLTKVQVAFVPVLKDLDFPLIFFYLPAFVLPFQAFALLPPVLSFLLWSLLNFLALVLYLAFFARKASASEKGLLVMLLLSLPVFYNFFWGQVNVWLVICVGEFMRALWEDRPWKAGAWLAGLLL